MNQPAPRRALFHLLTPLVAVALLLSPQVQAEEACYRNICVERVLSVGEERVELLGMARLTFWGFRVYTAALFTPPGVTAQEDILGDVPKRLFFHYHRGISRDDIIRAKMEFIDDNPNIDLNLIREELERMNALYTSVRSGDVYELVYDPAVGTSLILNGELQGTVEGALLAKAVFGLWLSEYPINNSLRDSLLRPYNR